MYSKWIKSGLSKPGKSAIGLAEALTMALKLKKPMHRITVHKMTSGIRKVKSEELGPISIYIEEPVPNISAPKGVGAVTVPIEREIGAGIWFEPGLVNAKPIGEVTVPVDMELPHAKPVAYTFKGDSMAGMGILNGETLVCIIPPNNDEIAEGRIVIIERNRAGLIELSARLVAKFKDRVEYRACSNNENYKPIVVYGKKHRSHTGSENETVRVVAILRRSMKTFS